MKYKISETKLYQRILSEEPKYINTQRSKIASYIIRYKTSSRNPQSKLKRTKTNSCSTRIFHLTHFANSNTFAKTYRKFMYGFTSLLEATFTQSDLN